MSYFLENLMSNSKPKKLTPSSAELRKLLPQVKPQKWLMYKDENGWISLFSLENQRIVLQYSNIDHSCNSIVAPFGNGAVAVYDLEVFTKIASAYIGKGNNYLYFEYGNPMESRKVPFHARKEDLKKEVQKEVKCNVHTEGLQGSDSSQCNS